jgi:hypothetical protein
MEKRSSKRISENKKRKYEDIVNDDINDDINNSYNDSYESNINKFLYVLHSICIDTNNHHIVHFYDKGGFVIKDLELFKKIVIQKYRLNDYQSFIRNLNNYGFVNITPRHTYDKRFFSYNTILKLNGNEMIYANPYFLHNYEELKELSIIKCENVHLHKNTFNKIIQDLHSNETNELISILLNLKNSKNI